jgi:hypothetical protein
MNQKELYLSQFPEALYPCDKNLLNEYRERVFKGCEIAKESSVAICEREQRNKNTITRINRISNMFGSCDIFIDRLPKDKKYDYVVLLDASLLGGYSYEGILNSIGWSEIWDVIASNGLNYDNVEDHWRRFFVDVTNFRRLNCWQQQREEDIRLLRYDRGERPIRCFSAFGGLAIYKGWLMQYISGDYMNMHKNMIENSASIWLNPSMITLYNKSEYSC